MSKLFIFIAGIALGAITGLFLAPYSGKQLMQETVGRLKELSANAEKQWEQTREQMLASIEETRKELQARIDEQSEKKS